MKEKQIIKLFKKDPGFKADAGIWNNIRAKIEQPEPVKSRNNKILLRYACGLLSVCIIAVVLFTIIKSNKEVLTRVDDWKYSNNSEQDGNFNGKALNSSVNNYSLAAADTIGLSTGGAKDINNFRKNIESNYFPQYSSLTYEGLFYDYYFDTGKKEQTDKLFSPSYTYAVSADPFSGQNEYYLSVGLNSGMKEKDFKRKKLNLVVVLDISDSMGGSMDNYYYDKGGSVKSKKEDEGDSKSKIDIAESSIVSLLGHLNKDDRFGMVTFNDDGYVAKPMSDVGKTDMEAIKKHILDIKNNGGTNFEAGYKEASKSFDKFSEADPNEYENRIIILTDAMPNTGDISEDSLLKMTKKNSEQRIFTTFIGIGVDFNTDLVEYITKIKGANYYSVHSSKEFKTRMDDEFEYMVTPLVFNLQLNLEAKGFKIEKVYGSPEADEATGQIMKVNTLFPSKQSDNKVKGGLILLKLKKISDDTELVLTTSYEDREGKVSKDAMNVSINESKADYYQNSGIRKGILLSRYADLLKNWMLDEAKNNTSDFSPSVSDEKGIVVPDQETNLLSKWEHQSVPLKVSNEYKQLFVKFIPYFENEMKNIGDATLSKEVDILKKLSNEK